ncbi:MAG TPA: ABC transporter ATP-binding protein [Casimicrobiaceae bacterium]|nr:ABC transporter ATP-binding protein [Casimicrobiaceae bacterium]
MIRLEALTKIYPSAHGGAASVDGVSLEVGAGETCVLLGPSGCGKTTTLRMVNQLVAPSSGRVFIGGRDTGTADPVELRRTIGYVIQQIGLFPNMTVAENIGVVPRLLHWDRARIRRRAEELLTMLALEPAEFLDRYPNELSGGQAQRVGVARALAADPPVLLMDEPFGAVDPVNREVIQDEFLRMQKSLRKTVLFVSHDIDEAVKMADRIAIFRAGRLEQYAAPDELLARPANEFVAGFVGSDRTLKRLRRIAVSEVMTPEARGSAARVAPGTPAVGMNDDLRRVATLFLERGIEVLSCVDGDGRCVGHVTREAVAARLAAPSAATALGAAPQ